MPEASPDIFLPLMILMACAGTVAALAICWWLEKNQPWDCCCGFEMPSDLALTIGDSWTQIGETSEGQKMWVRCCRSSIGEYEFSATSEPPLVTIN